MTKASNLSIPTCNCHKPFVFNQVPKNVFQFTVIAMKNWQIKNKISPPASPNAS